jgi:hypothetical protein
LVIFVFSVLGIGLLTLIVWAGFIFLIPLLGFSAILFLIAFYSMTMKTTISDNEISAQSFLGIKTLRWNEISRVSGMGYTIKLQNLDGDVTVAPASQLPGYDEVVEWIGTKRPDLFNPLEYREMTKSWLSTVYLPAMGILIIGMGVFILTQASDTFVPFIILVAIGLFFIGSIFTTPQSLTINGNSLFIKYLLNQKTLSADEIRSVELKYRSTRNGRVYFVMLNLNNQKNVRISGLSPNLPVVYLVLKNWHKK